MTSTKFNIDGRKDSAQSSIHFFATGEMLLRHFDVRLSSDENERNSLAIFCMKCAGVKENDNKITLKRLFPLEKFGKVSRKLCEQEMLFDGFQQIEWGHQITKENWKGILDQHKTTGCFLVNGKCATFADMIMISEGGCSFLPGEATGSRQEAIDEEKKGP